VVGCNVVAFWQRENKFLYFLGIRLGGSQNQTAGPLVDTIHELGVLWHSNKDTVTDGLEGMWKRNCGRLVYDNRRYVCA
jgi:hypothetical protein